MMSGTKNLSEEKTPVSQPGMEHPTLPLPVLHEKAEPQLRLLAELVSEKARSLVDKLHYRPITLQMEDPLFLALSKLAEGDILAAPVLGEANEYCGFIDMMQLVHYVIELCGCDTNLALGLSKNRTFRQTRVSQIMGPSPPGIPDGSSMYLALELLAITGLQRLAVLNIYNNVLSIVTQSMLIEWLAENVHLMSEGIRRTPISVLKPYSWVIAVNEDQPVLSAFKMMQKRNVSGIAVLDYRDRIVDVVSARDLRGLGSSSLSFAGLLSSVKSLKENVRKQYLQTPTQVQVVLPSDTFEDLLLCMARKKVHRVFVVRSRESAAPVNTISQTDLLRFVLESLLVHASSEPFVPPEARIIDVPKKIDVSEEEKLARARAWEEKEAKTRAMLPPVVPNPVQRSLYPSSPPRAWPTGWPYRAWRFRPPVPTGGPGKPTCPPSCTGPVEKKFEPKIPPTAGVANVLPRITPKDFARDARDLAHTEHVKDGNGKGHGGKELSKGTEDIAKFTPPPVPSPPALPPVVHSQAQGPTPVRADVSLLPLKPAPSASKQPKPKAIPKQSRKLVWTKEGKTLADQIVDSLASGNPVPGTSPEHFTPTETKQLTECAVPPLSLEPCLPRVETTEARTEPAKQMEKNEKEDERKEAHPSSERLDQSVAERAMAEPEVKRNHVFKPEAPPFTPASPAGAFVLKEAKLRDSLQTPKRAPQSGKRSWLRKVA